MNPEIQKELLSWLQGLRQLVESGAAFAKDQIPQVLWEKILLDRVYYTVLEGLFATVLVTSIVALLRKWGHKWAEEESDASEGFSWAVVIAPKVIGLLLGIIVVFGNLYPFRTVWFAPRIYLIDWLKELVKG